MLERKANASDRRGLLVLGTRGPDGAWDASLESANHNGRDPAEAARFRTGLIDNMRRRGGADKLLVVEGPRQGRRLSEIAAEVRLDPADAAMAPTVAMANFQLSIMTSPFVEAGTDGGRALRSGLCFSLFNIASVQCAHT